jgi:hypothetical protein
MMYSRKSPSNGAHVELKNGCSEMRRILITTRRAEEGDAKLLADLGRQTSYETFAASNKAEGMDAYSEAAFDIDRIVDELRQ